MFDMLVQKYGRAPTILEMDEYLPGSADFARRKYRKSIRKWLDYVAFRGHYRFYHFRRWTPDKIDSIFDKLYEETQREVDNRMFLSLCPGAIRAIRERRYHRSVYSWNSYLEFRGFETRQNTWTKEKLDEAFLTMVKNGRVPSYDEFNVRYGNPFGFITSGRYDPDIRTWNKFVEHHGFVPNSSRWKVTGVRNK